MTAITKDLIEINLSTDELMLKELERRDGIYSFIFHELEVPKVDMPITGIAPTKLINGNYTTTIRRHATATTTTAREEHDDTSTTSNDNNNNNNDEANHDNDSLPDEQQIKTEALLLQQNTTTTINSPTFATITLTTTTRTIAFTTPVTNSFINIFPCNVSAATTTTTSLPSLFTTTTPPPLPTTSYHSTLGISAAAAACLPSLSGMSMRSYHDYLKTWHPAPSSLVYDNPKLYAYMANCGFRVRAATPRFSHITAPLVRNRRHALKETPQYKRASDGCLCRPVADLRELFPHDPDVHAPFAMTMAVTTTTALLGDDEAGAVEFDEDCCGDVVLMEGTTILE